MDAEDPHHPLAVVQLKNGARVRVAFELLEHHDNGGYTLAGRWSDFPALSDEGAEIPVIAERVKVDVRPAPPRRLRVRRKVIRESREVDVPLWRERLVVERVPVNQFVDQAPQPRHEGDTLIVPCVEEVPVVTTRLRVREELRVRVVRERYVHREAVVVRKHEIEIEGPEPALTRSKDQGDKP